MRRLLIVILILLPFLITAVGLIVWGRRELNTTHLHSHENSYIEIPRGSTPDEIAKKLSGLGIIRHEWLFRLYIRYSGVGPRLKAGEYRFPSPISPLAVLEKLEGGEQRLSRFTVIEGWTRWDIAEHMARIPELGLRNADEALALMDDVSLIHDLQVDAKNLEGFLYPDTYSFPPDTTAKELVVAMVKRFRQTWEEQFAEQARSTNKSLMEIMTVASLIETEAKLKEERPIVASVIYNRKAINMPLGIDSTIIYASKLAGKWKDDGKVYQSDIDRNSPYNTRKVIGLPPGPVGSPGASSIEAALNPSSTNYLYYVREPSRDDGAHNFYSNEADFQRGVTKLREWERSRDSGKVNQLPEPN